MREILISNKGMETISKKSKKNPEIMKILGEAKSKLEIENFESSGTVKLLKGEDGIYVFDVKKNYRVIYTLEKNDKGDTVVLLLSIYQKQSKIFDKHILKNLWNNKDSNGF